MYQLQRFRCLPLLCHTLHQHLSSNISEFQSTRWEQLTPEGHGKADAGLMELLVHDSHVIELNCSPSR